MAKKTYIGANNLAHRVRKIYLGVGNVARKVRKGYIGVAGKARLFFLSNTSIHYLRQAQSPTTERGYMKGTGNPSYALFAGGRRFHPSSQVFATVDAYDSRCVHSLAPDLRQADASGGAAQAGNYAVFNMYYYTQAYSKTLTVTNLGHIAYKNYEDHQGASFRNYAIFNAGREMASIAGQSYYKRIIAVIDDSLTIAAKVDHPNWSEIKGSDFRGSAAAGSEDYYMTAGGTYTTTGTVTYSDGTTSTTDVYMFSYKAAALNSALTRIDCADLSQHDVYTPHSVNGAASTHHIFFKLTRSNTTKAVDVYDDSLTHTQLPDVSLIRPGGRGTSFIGFAVFPGPTALTLVDDSLTITQVPFSVTKFNDDEVAITKDKMFYASDGVADEVPDMSVHVFEAY